MKTVATPSGGGQIGQLIDKGAATQMCALGYGILGMQVRVLDPVGAVFAEATGAPGACEKLARSNKKVDLLLDQNEREAMASAAKSAERGQEPVIVAGALGWCHAACPVALDGTPVAIVLIGPFARGVEDDATNTDAAKLDDEAHAVLAKASREACCAHSDQEVLSTACMIAQGLHCAAQSTTELRTLSEMHASGIARTAEEKARIRRELRDAKLALQDLDRLKANFVATISHELRTPLTSIIGYAEMLNEGMASKLGEKERNYAKTILQRGEHLLRLIGQVLDLSRMESGYADMRVEPHEPGVLVRMATDEIERTRALEGRSVHVDMAKNVPPIRVDGAKVVQALVHLLENALKFTAKDGAVELQVHVLEAPPPGAKEIDPFNPMRNKHLCFDVRDTGIGVPHEKQNLIFESFYQVDSSSTRSHGGLGIGLSVARNLVRVHGGRIEVCSEQGKGSVFSIVLPYVPAPVLDEDG